MFPYESSLVSRVLAQDATHCALDFDPDPARWPWLDLPCWHPVVCEKYAYFSGVTAGMEVGTISATSFTALTGMDWSYRGAQTAQSAPTHAICESRVEAQQAGYSVCTRDATDRVVHEISGKGVIFRTRDFENWRQQRKQADAEDLPRPDFEFATAAVTGCRSGDEVLISDLVDDPEQGTLRCLAWLDADHGFHPGHPYHTGSRDHVNAAQLLDCAYQASHLVLAQQSDWQTLTPPLYCTGGKARFKNYVELQRDFELLVTGVTVNGSRRTLRFDLQQGGTICARLSLDFCLAAGDHAA